MGALLLRLEGITLICCGLGCFYGCYMAQDVIEQAFLSACAGAAEAADCVGDMANSTEPIPAYTQDQCRLDIKEKMGCTCPLGTLDSCDCSGSYIELVQENWPMGCFIGGIAACVICVVFTGLPAFIASKKKMRCCSIFTFSLMCIIFAIPFLFIGGSCTAIAILIRRPATIGIDMDDCEGSVANLSSAASDKVSSQMDTATAVSGQSLESTGDAEADAALNATALALKACGAKAFCAGVRNLSGDMFWTATYIGIPFGIAGILMAIGMFWCCLWRKGLPDKKVKPGKDDVRPFTDIQQTSSKHQTDTKDIQDEKKPPQKSPSKKMEQNKAPPPETPKKAPSEPKQETAKLQKADSAKSPKMAERSSSKRRLQA
uniref:Uncharacterized protein n=1 Tax=Hemiselmis andersenii TaxID=464988 RepID=A0A6U2AY73_HEMAN